MKTTQTVSLSKAPTVTKVDDNGNLVIDDVTIAGGRDSTVSATFDTNNYKISAGVLNNTGTNQVSLTGDYNTDNAYEVGNGITFVTAAGLSKGVSIKGGSTAVTVQGGAGADSIVAGNGGGSISGGEGADTLVAGAGAVTLTGDGGNDVFDVSGASKAYISDYTSGDTIQITPAKASLSGNDVVFDGNVTVANGKDKLITISDGTNPTTGAFYSVNGTDPTTLILLDSFTGTATAENYKPDGTTPVTKVNASAAGDITLSGFTSISGMKATQTVSLASVADATVKGGDLVISGNDTVTIAGAATSIISAVVGGKSYKISAGVLNSADESRVSLTGNYDTDKAYQVGDGTTFVTAAALSNGVTIKGGSTAVTVQGGSGADSIVAEAGGSISGGAGADTLVAGTGDVTLVGDAGDDVFVTSTGKAYISDYTSGDTIQIAPTKASLNGNDVVFDGNVTVKDGKDKTITTKSGDVITTGAYYSNASVNADDTAILYAGVTGTIKAGDYKPDGKTITAVNASLAGAVTFSGFTSISGLQANQTIAPSTAPTLTKADGDNLVIDNITVAGAAASIISAVVGDKAYAIGAGMLNNAADNRVSLTADYNTETAYEVGDRTTFVTAAALTKGVAIKGGSTAVSIQGGAGADSIVAVAGGSISGGAGADTLVAGTGDVTLIGDGGDDVFVTSTGKALISDYTAGDIIQIAPTKASLSGSDVVFNGNVTVAGVKDSLISYANNGATLSGAFYDNASVNGTDATTLILLEGFTSTATAGDYNPGGKAVTAVNASLAGDDVTLSGFTSISGMKATQILSLSTTPTLTKADGDDLIIDNITIAGAADSVISAVVDDDTYEIGAGVLYGTNDNKVTLTADYDTANVYEVADDITFVTAANMSKGVSIKGGSTNLSIEGGAGDDTLIAGAGTVTLTGKDGDDVFVTSNGKAYISDYTAGDTIQMEPSSAALSGDDVVFNGRVSVAGGKDKLITVSDGTTDTTGAFYSNASIDATDTNTLILLNGFRNTALASDYNPGGKAVTAVNASLGSDSVLLSGFKTIVNMKTTQSVSLASVDDATVSGVDLVIKGNDTVTIALAAQDTVKADVGGKSHVIGAGVIANTKDNAVSITGSREAGGVNLYEYGTTFTSIDATKATTEINIKAVENTVGATINATGVNSSVTIQGGLGDDSIVGGTKNDVLIGGAGNDTFAFSAGSDTIDDYEEGDVVNLSEAYSDHSVSGSNVILTFESGDKLQINNATDKSIAFNVANGAENDTVSFSRDGALISGDGATLNTHIDGSYTAPSGIVTVNASETKDGLEIVGNELGNLIIGGEGNDTLNGASGSDTLRAGAGDVTFTGGSGKDVFVLGAGKATITDYTAGDDTIQFTAAPTKATLSGNDVVFDDNVTVKSGKDKLITISDGTTATTGAFYDNASVNGTDATTLILLEGFTGTVTASDFRPGGTRVTAVDTSAVGAVTLSGFTSITGLKENQTISLPGVSDASVSGDDLVINGTITIAGAANSVVNAIVGNSAYKISAGVMDDTRTNQVTLTANYNAANVYEVAGGTTFVSAANMTQGAVIRSSATATTIQGSANADSIVASAGGSVSGGAGADTLVAGTGNVTLNGGTGNDLFVTGAGRVYISDYTSGNDVIQVVPNSAGLSGNDVVFNGNVTVASGRDKLITISNGTTGVFYDNASVNGSDTSTLILSNSFTGTVSAGDYRPNGSAVTDVNVSAAGDVTISGFKSISGLKNNQAVSLARITNASVSGNNLVISGNETVTIMGAANSAVNVVNGSNRYVVRNGLIYNAEQTAVSLLTANRNYDATNDTSVSSIVASAAGATIKGGSTSVTIQGGAGADEITGGTGNDLLIGGARNDTFVYSEGSDTIRDYQEGDVIKLPSMYRSYSMTGSNVILNFGNDRMQINNATNKTVTFNVAGAATNNTVRFSGDGAVVSGSGVTLNADYRGRYTAASGIVNVDASSAVRNVTIVGNAQNNSLVGGAGSDSLDGGAGDDTLVGGNGNDVFIYSGGKDLIQDFSNGDSIRNTFGNTIADVVTAADGALVLKFNDRNELSISGATAGVAIAGTGNTAYSYTAQQVTDNSKGVTLYAAGSNHTLANGLVSLDGSRAGSGNLTGNAANNYILASKAGSTMNGGAGSDTLVGSDGADTFVVSAGNDIFSNFTFSGGAQDKISLGSGITAASFTDATAVSGGTRFTHGSGTVQINGFTAGQTIDLSNGNSLKSTGIILSGSNGSTYQLFSNAGSGTYTAGTASLGSARLIDASLATRSVTLNAGNGGSTLVGGSGTDVFVYNGGNVSIGGFDKGEKIQLAGSVARATISGVTVRNNNITLTFGTGNTLNISGTGIANSPINIGGTTYYFDDDLIMNNTASKATAVTVLGGNFNANNYSKVSTITSRAADEQNLTGNSGNNVITAGSGGAVLNGGTGKDTLIGGAGEDTFVHNGGKKVVTTIQNYNPNDDVVSGVTMSQIEKTSISGKTLTLELTDGSKVLITSDKYGSGKLNTLNLNSGAIIFGDNAIYNKNSSDKVTSVTLTSAFKGTFDGGKVIGSSAANTVTITGAEVDTKNKLKIVGTDNDDVITASDGKRTTLQGGKGDDVLYGGSGADNFVYASSDTGDDVIANFDCAKDSIRIDRAVSKINGATFTLNGSGNELSVRFANGRSYDADHVLYEISNKLYGFQDGQFVTAKNNKNGKADLTAISKAVDSGNYRSGYAIIELSGSGINSFKKNTSDYTFSTDGGFQAITTTTTTKKK